MPRILLGCKSTLPMLYTSGTAHEASSMLTIREQQLKVLAQEMFVSWMISHLKEFFPREASGLDHTEMRRRILVASQRARQYGFNTESQLCRYIDLTFVLPPSFDDNPELPWASEILSDSRIKDADTRMDLLYGAAQDYLEQIEQSLPTDEASGWA